MENKILCPYCSKEYTGKMLENLEYSEGSYTADCIYDSMVGNIDIICEHCDKLIYRKEVKIMLEEVSNLRWNKNE